MFRHFITNLQALLNRAGMNWTLAFLSLQPSLGHFERGPDCAQAGPAHEHPYSDNLQIKYSGPKFKRSTCDARMGVDCIAGSGLLAGKVLCTKKSRIQSTLTQVQWIQHARLNGRDGLIRINDG